uniref:Uncharacterized protein n=1 Tax=Romanomermis culicivorax TaxID=13658 RepID=A0A915K3W4_ROMCU
MDLENLSDPRLTLDELRSRKLGARRIEIRDVVISTKKIKERKMLLQAALLCAATTISIVSFSLSQYISLPPYLNVASNIVWLLAAGSNSIVHLTLNNL